MTEPTEEQIRQRMKDTGLDWYNVREQLREEKYGEKPPAGYQSCGDYWKSY